MEGIQRILELCHRHEAHDTFAKQQVSVLQASVTTGNSQHQANFTVLHTGQLEAERLARRRHDSIGKLTDVLMGVNNTLMDLGREVRSANGPASAMEHTPTTESDRPGTSASSILRDLTPEQFDILRRTLVSPPHHLNKPTPQKPTEQPLRNHLGRRYEPHWATIRTRTGHIVPLPWHTTRTHTPPASDTHADTHSNHAGRSLLRWRGSPRDGAGDDSAGPPPTGGRSRRGYTVNLGSHRHTVPADEFGTTYDWDILLLVIITLLSPYITRALREALRRATTITIATSTFLEKSIVRIAASHTPYSSEWEHVGRPVRWTARGGNLRTGKRLYSKSRFVRTPRCSKKWANYSATTRPRRSIRLIRLLTQLLQDIRRYPEADAGWGGQAREDTDRSTALARQEGGGGAAFLTETPGAAPPVPQRPTHAPRTTPNTDTSVTHADPPPTRGIYADEGRASWLHLEQVAGIIQLHNPLNKIRIPLLTGVSAQSWKVVWAHLRAYEAEEERTGIPAVGIHGAGTMARYGRILLRHKRDQVSGVYPMYMPGHWRIMIVSHALGQIVLLDPFGNRFTRAEVKQVQQSYVGYAVSNMTLLLQKDCWNCGVWVAWVGSIWSEHVNEGHEGTTSIERVIRNGMRMENIYDLRNNPHSDQNATAILRIRRQYRQELDSPTHPPHLTDWIAETRTSIAEIRRLGNSLGRPTSTIDVDMDDSDIEDTTDGRVRPPKKPRTQEPPSHTDSRAPNTPVTETGTPAHPRVPTGHTGREHTPKPKGSRSKSVRKPTRLAPDGVRPLSTYFQKTTAPTIPPAEEGPATRARVPPAPVHSTPSADTSDWLRSYTPSTLPDDTPLIAVTWNTNGIRTKNVAVEGASQLDMVVKATCPDILLLQETHYTAGAEHRGYIEGYTVYHSSVPRGRTRSGKPIDLPTYQQGHRAGLATAIKNSLGPHLMATRLEETQGLRGYLLPLRVQTQRGGILVINTYLPPDDTHRNLIMEQIHEWIRTHRKVGEPVLLGGDLNAAWMTGDRAAGRLTTRDTHYRRWATAIGFRPTDLWHKLTVRDHTYETHHADVVHGTHQSRIDDWLLLAAPEMGIADTVFPTRTEVRSDIPHTSDHHPLVLRMSRTHIPIQDGLDCPKTGPSATIRRLKQNITPDMLESLRDALSHGVRAETTLLHRTVTAALLQHHADGKQVVGDISRMVDTLLTNAWEITLREVGETVRLGPAHPIRRRANQSGHLKNTSKKKYKQLLRHLHKVRRTIRAVSKVTKATPTPAQLEEIQQILQREMPTRETSENTTWESLQLDLVDTRTSIRQILTRHDRERTLTKLKKFQRLLHENPKRAHRWIFEGGDRKELSSVRLSTGELCSTPEEVIREVTKVYTERQKPVVAKETAGAYPWEHPHRTQPLIPDSGGTHSRLGDRYSEHIYQDCLGRLPGRKAPGPDGVPNEVLKNLPPEFHEAVHGLFQLMWKYECTPPQWKDDNTILLYKKGDPSVIQNHRPIGLKRTIYKLWTATVTRVLTEYIDEHALIGEAQAGFRTGRSTTHQLQRLRLALEDAKLTKSDIQVLYVDFTDAFGSVDHARLHCIMESMGIPEDAVGIIKDLYQGASIVVKTPKGDTQPIPIEGRGTIQGDTLSPLLFIIYMEPLLRWLQEGRKSYKMKTSHEEVGPLAYADDLSVVTEDPQDAISQAHKIETYCDWAGIGVNVDPVRRNKTVYTSITRTRGTLAQHVGPFKPATPSQLTIQGHTIPHMTSHESYRYLGVLINLELDWTEQWAALMAKVTEEAHLINTCGATTGQQLHMVNTVMRPAIRYSMTVVPYTWDRIQGLHAVLMNCARKAGGLSCRASTLLMMRPKGEYGVGMDSVYHTYIYTALDATDSLFQSQDDRGRMARGLWDSHTYTIDKSDIHKVDQRSIARLPTLLLRTQLAQLGIRLETHLDQEEATRRKKLRSSLTELRAGGQTNLKHEAMGEPRHMTAFWDLGLCELSDFTDFRGVRIMTYAELKDRHRDKTLTGRHRKSYTMLCAHLGCTEGGTLDAAYHTDPIITDLHSILLKYPHMRATGLLHKHAQELEDEDSNRSVFDPPPRRSGRLRLPPKRTRKRKQKLRPNPDIRPPPSATSTHGLRTWTYKEISAVRKIENVSQWLVHWLGGDESGPYEPTWEPLESFEGAEEHPTDTLRRFQQGESSAIKDKLPVRPATSHRAWNNKRVRARIFVEENGEQIPIFKTGVMVVNPDKATPGALPYVIRYDDPSESDEEVNPNDPEDHIEPIDHTPPPPNPETEYRKPIRDTIRSQNLLLIHSDETQPDRENIPTGDWTMVEHSTNAQVIEVHDPRGKWVGDISPDRATILLQRFTVATNDPSVRKRLTPGSFQQEVGLLLLRYQSGKKITGNKKVKMSNHWTTPPPLIREGLLRTYDIGQERFASPLNFNPSIPEYWSAFPQDALFGAHHDAYSSRMTACGYMNPEYEEDELEKALQYAVWASETDTPVCFLAVYPEWGKATYMNLLSHNNVQVVARFRRSTFSFLPPDHWKSSGSTGHQPGTARWQVMVIEISNKSGREKYKVGPESLIAEAGRSFGAKPESNHSINTCKRHRRKFPAPSKQFLNTPEFSTVAVERTPPTPGPDLSTYTTSTERKYPHGKRIFTDGSLIDRQGVGAAYYDESTSNTTYIHVDQRDILRAELTAILRVVQDRATDPEPLQIFTDSLTSIRLLRRWIHCPTALSKTDNLDLLDSLAYAIAQRAPARTELYKVRAHIGCEGNEQADTGAKKVARGETGDTEVVSAQTTHTPPYQSTNPFTMADGEPIVKPKIQLRQPIADWLTVTRNLMTTVSDMWQGEDASKLDPVASNAVLWGTGNKKGMYRPLHVLRFRFLEAMTNAKLHEQNPKKHPKNTCDLCTQPGTWFHMASMCPHPDISEYYTVRHNAAGKELTKGIRAGKLGRWLTITSFGKTDGLGDPETIPSWMLSDEGRARVKLPIPDTTGDTREQMAEGRQPGSRPTPVHGTTGFTGNEMACCESPAFGCGPGGFPLKKGVFIHRTGSDSIDRNPHVGIPWAGRGAEGELEGGSDG